MPAGMRHEGRQDDRPDPLRDDEAEEESQSWNENGEDQELAEHDADERPQPPKRDHEAQQEQQMIGPVEDVKEPEPDEGHRRLQPTGVQSDKTRIARKLERTDSPARRQEPEDRDDADSQPRNRR